MYKLQLPQTNFDFLCFGEVSERFAARVWEMLGEFVGTCSGVLRRFVDEIREVLGGNNTYTKSTQNQLRTYRNISGTIARCMFTIRIVLVFGCEALNTRNMFRFIPEIGPSLDSTRTCEVFTQNIVTIVFQIRNT